MTVFIKGSLETVVETSLLQTTVSANLGRFSPASHLPGQSWQNTIKELIGFLIVFSDVSVAVKSKHAGVG